MTDEKTPKRDHPAPPKELLTAGRALWLGVVKTYDLRVDELAVLKAAAQTADMIARLDREWAGLGRPFMAFGSQGQQIIHPLIGERRAQQAQLAKLLAQLKLPDENEVAAPNQQRAAVQSRWAKHGQGS